MGQIFRQYRNNSFARSEVQGVYSTRGDIFRVKSEGKGQTVNTIVKAMTVYPDATFLGKTTKHTFHRFYVKKKRF